MRRAEAHRWVQLYVDGRLDAHQLPALARHLHTCATCRLDLAAYHVVVEGASLLNTVPQPDDLTAAIMTRIQQAEAHSASTAGRSTFALGWADTLLAAGLATVMTLAFLVFEPALRVALAGALAVNATTLAHLAAAKASSWPSLAVWLVWVGVGLCLALWFAGREVREGWRRTLVTRLTR